jgi:hypothetical protein
MMPPEEGQTPAAVVQLLARRLPQAAEDPHSQLVRLNLRAGLFGARDFGLREAKGSDYERVLRKTMSELCSDDRRDHADQNGRDHPQSAPEADDAESEEGDQARTAATAAAA